MRAEWLWTPVYKGLEVSWWWRGSTHWVFIGRTAPEFRRRGW